MSYDLGIDLDALLDEPGLASSSEVEVVRPMERKDYEVVGQGNTGVDYAPKKITERHHALARALASGMKDYEACALVGMTSQMLFYLKRSPAFLDLVAMYRENVEAQFAGLVDQFEGLTKDAMLELRDRLEAAPETFTNGTLLEMVKVVGDRAGYAPVQKQVTVNMSLGEKLKLARERAMRARDITPSVEATE